SEIKRRAFARLRLGPDPAAMSVDDALHGGQTQTVPDKLLRAMETMEHAEEFVLVAHVKADAVVAHEIDNAFLGLARADADKGGSARRAELERVVQQVGPDLAQEHRVADGFGQRADLEVRVGLRMGGAQRVHYVSRQRA